jgi:hypothetical protein
MIFP